MKARHAIAVLLAISTVALFFGVFSGFSGSSIAGDPKSVYNGRLGNETIRADLGRATWRLLHTMAGRYSDLPSDEQRHDTETFIQLLAMLYPCGQCAEEFQLILTANPPRLNSRDEFVQWACDVHNIVNIRLGKPVYDCEYAAQQWMCGCVDAEEEGVEEDI